MLPVPRVAVKTQSPFPAGTGFATAMASEPRHAQGLFAAGLQAMVREHGPVQPHLLELVAAAATARLKPLRLLRHSPTWNGGWPLRLAIRVPPHPRDRYPHRPRDRRGIPDPGRRFVSQTTEEMRRP